MLVDSSHRWWIRLTFVLFLGATALYVFQRAPSSIDVRNNTPTSPDWVRSLQPGWQQARMDNFNALVSGVALLWAAVRA